MLLGLVTSYAGLVVIRAFLGLVEGPMFPGIVLYLSGFYTRAELSLRSEFVLYCALPSDEVVQSVSRYFSHRPQYVIAVPPSGAHLK